MLKSTPTTSKNRSRSSIFELNQDTPEIHPWYKFGPNVTNICSSYCIYKWKLLIFMLKLTPWPKKIGQGHPSSNFAKTLLRYIHGISLGPMRLIFVQLSCLQVKIANFHVEIRLPWPRKIGQGHPSSNLTKDTPEVYLWYKFGPNATNICAVIVFTSENCKFSCWNQLPWPRKIGQGHPS